MLYRGYERFSDEDYVVKPDELCAEFVVFFFFQNPKFNKPRSDGDFSAAEGFEDFYCRGRALYVGIVAVVENIDAVGFYELKSVFDIAELFNRRGNFFRSHAEVMRDSRSKRDILHRVRAQKLCVRVYGFSAERELETAAVAIGYDIGNAVRIRFGAGICLE